MIEVKAEKTKVSCNVQGFNRDLVEEAVGIVVEGFKILHEINYDVYAKAASQIMTSILTGELPEIFKDCEIERSGFEVDPVELLRQMKEEEGKN